MNTLRIALPIVLALVVASAVSVALAEHLTDPKGFITFDMPDGWNNERFKNGRHFTREGSTDNPNILGVVPEHRDRYMTREKMSEGRKRVHEMQGHNQVFDRTTWMNGFEVWEGVFEANIRGQDVVLHTYLLFSDSLMVDVHLNASKNVYDEYLPDLKSLVASVCVTDAAKELGLRGP